MLYDDATLPALRASACYFSIKNHYKYNKINKLKIWHGFGLLKFHLVY